MLFLICIFDFCRVQDGGHKIAIYDRNHLFWHLNYDIILSYAAKDQDLAKVKVCKIESSLHSRQALMDSNY